MKKISTALIITTTLALSSTAFAAPTDSAGYYIGANLGYSSMDMGNIRNLVPADSYTATGLAFNLHGGYMLNQYVGAELGYSSYGDASASRAGVKELTMKQHSFDATAKGVYRFNPQWAGFAKAGFAYTTLNTTIYTQSTAGSQIAPLVGLGAAYDVTPNITLNASWSVTIGTRNVYAVDNAKSMIAPATVNVFYGGLDYHF
jgi:opacity protein-like surface antigen